MPAEHHLPRLATLVEVGADCARVVNAAYLIQSRTLALAPLTVDVTLVHGTTERLEGEEAARWLAGLARLTPPSPSPSDLSGGLPRAKMVRRRQRSAQKE